MIRLNIVAEGQTEETFINNVLRNHLARFNVFVSVRCMETGRSKRRGKVYRGGFLSYLKLKKDLDLWMRQDRHPEARFSTMVDLYALPDDFPDYSLTGRQKDPFVLVKALEGAMQSDMASDRFIPYIQLHEFEALLLIEPIQFSTFFPEHAAAIRNLVALAAQFGSPEEIDQGETTAPSKRIISMIPEYEDLKVFVAASIAEKIGIDAIRMRCPHFNDWLSGLELLDKTDCGN